MTRDYLDTPLGELEIPIRMWNCFKNAGFKTIRDVLSNDEGELLRIPNFGRKSINEFNEIIRPHGLQIAGRSKRYVGLSISRDVYERIKVRALANNRSVESEAIDLLSSAVRDDGEVISVIARLDRLEAVVFRP